MNNVVTFPGNGQHPAAPAPRGFGAVPDVSAPPAAPILPLADLLEQVRAFLCAYIVFPAPEQASAVALWIVHTWVIEAFTFTPYLSIGSPVKRCGKSTLLDCLAMLVRAAWQVVSPSPPVLFRKIERDCPTLLLDEVDTTRAAGLSSLHPLGLAYGIALDFAAGELVLFCYASGADREEDNGWKGLAIYFDGGQRTALAAACARLLAHVSPF